MTLPLFIILGILANRHRGGWIGTGHTQLARFDFAVILALLFLIGSLDPVAAAVTIPLTFLGCLAGQGDNQADDTALKALGLVGSALCNVAGVVAVGLWLHWSWTAALAMPIAMAGKPLAYLIGRYLPGTLIPVVFGQGFARGQTEWGEVLFGAVEGVVVWWVTGGF